MAKCACVVGGLLACAFLILFLCPLRKIDSFMFRFYGGGRGRYSSAILDHTRDAVATHIYRSCGVKPILAFGTLLGYIRDGRSINNDDDVDFFILRQGS